MRSLKEYIGGVPVVVRLADDDVLHPTERPAPAAFVLPRTTLLLAIVRDLLQLFRPYAAALHPETTQVWFSVRDTPLSWLYAAGVVKDYVNECVREERTSHLTAAAAAFSTSSSAPSSAAANAALLQAHLCSILSEPLELTFHIHSLTKGSALARTVPLYVNYDRLDEHIRMEVKQAHKAAYTVLYGNYAVYQREAESALQAAVGLALYRPFDAAAQEQLQQQQRFRDMNNNSGGGGAASAMASPRGGVGGGSGGFAAPIVVTSPYLLAEYQQLLRDLLTPRPHVAWLFRLGFPFAYRGAGSRSEGGYLQYDTFRVSAAPALRGGGDARSAAAGLVEPEQLSLGLLLWRLFRLPVLRSMAAAGHPPVPQPGSAVPATTPLTEAQATYQRLLRSLAPYYADAPASATERLAEQEPLLAATPPEPPAWAAWEQSMSARLMEDYAGTGLPFAGVAAITPADEVRRIRFVVQGIQPPLATPASFLEANLSSSDRAIFVTVQV